VSHPRRQAVLALALLACLEAPRVLGGEGSEAEERQRALWLGMDYMERSAVRPEHFALYASDYLFFLADIHRDPDPWLQLRARALGQELADRYLASQLELDSADGILDAASALWAMDELGLDVTAPLGLVREAARALSPAQVWGFDPTQGELPDTDRVIDLLIGLFFTDRMRVPVGVSFAEALAYAAGVDYALSDPDDDNRYVELNNLVTHLIYTLSGYASWSLDARWLPREEAYLLGNLDRALAWADPESVAEYTDSLLILGHDPTAPPLRQARRLLLALQRPDGRWEPEGADDEYDRYHATWCAMDALREYAFEGGDRLPDALTARVVLAWADQVGAGLPLDPWMPVSEAARDE
jgi:hypothetical protein